MSSHPRFLPIHNTPAQVLTSICKIHTIGACPKIKPNFGDGDGYICETSYPTTKVPPDLQSKIPCSGTQHLTCPGWLVLREQQDAEQVA